MTGQATARRQPRLYPVLVIPAALFPMTFVILVVNFWIYYARYLYIRRYPAETSAHAPTISRAISDPAIGSPFALWISTSAVLLFVAWIILARLNWRFARSLPASCKRTARFIKWGVAGICGLQFMTSVGMITLSLFPLETARDAHMLGSYIFFAAQSFSILLATVIAFRIKNDAASCAVLRDLHGVPRGVFQLRSALGCLSVFLAVAFTILFVVKDFPLTYQKQVHGIYVIVEPSLISSFLIVFATYYVELLRSFAAGPRLTSHDGEAA